MTDTLRARLDAAANCVDAETADLMREAIARIDAEIQVRMSGAVPLLDHGFIRLIDFMGSDLSIVRAARVSHAAAWRAGENEGSDARLIRYLWRNKHATPFEAVTVTLEVKAPIFVFRQWHRHRTQAYNELSARYRALPEEYYVPAPDVITLPGDIKQGRSAEIHPQAARIAALIRASSVRSFAEYQQLLEMGTPRELARSVLPVNTYSHMFATASLRNWFAFLDLRADAHAQYEIRVYAEAMIELLRTVAPVAVKAWEENHGK